MSRRSTDTRARASRLAVLGLLGLFSLLAACASSGPPAPEARGANEPPAAERGSRRDAPPAVPDEVPEDARRAFDAALVALEAERFAEAEAALEALARDYPGYPGPHVNLAMLYERDGRVGQARAALEAALAADPGHCEANNELGIVLRRAGEFEAAEAAYRRALETDPDYALAHYNLGVLLDLYLHRREEALAHYERYQALVAEPDRTVAAWIVDLRRRLGVPADETARVAQEDRP